MQKDKFVKHYLAAEAALVKASNARYINATRQSWAAVAASELAACDLILRYPDVSYGPLP